MTPPPEYLASWTGRYDDAQKRFQTLYLADDNVAAAMEVLASLRPSVSERARIIEAKGPDSPLLAMMGRLDIKDVNDSQVVRAGVQPHHGTEGIAVVEDLKVRQVLEEQFPAELQAFGVKNLDIGLLRGPNRPLTRAIAGMLYDMGYAAVQFNSKLEGAACLGVFGDRAAVELLEVEGMMHEQPVLQRVLIPACKKLGLKLVNN